jgi:phosphoglycolate phosphatase-like HAD superfamily hydrolase
VGLVSALLALDLDGTLIDCKRRQIAAAHTILQELSDAVIFDEERFWSLKRTGATTLQALEALGVTLELAIRATEAWTASIEDRCWLELDTLLPMSIEALLHAHECTLDVVVLTARRSVANVADELHRLHLDAFVDDLRVVDPNKALAEKAATLQTLKPFGYVGDTEVDWEAALQAVVPCVITTTGQRDHGYLLQRGVYRLSKDVAHAVRLITAEGFTKAGFRD